MTSQTKKCPGELAGNRGESRRESFDGRILADSRQEASQCALCGCWHHGGGELCPDRQECREDCEARRMVVDLRRAVDAIESAILRAWMKGGRT